jgi:hypothetical protein
MFKKGVIVCNLSEALVENFESKGTATRLRISRLKISRKFWLCFLAQ